MIPNKISEFLWKALIIRLDQHILPSYRVELQPVVGKSV